MRWKLSDIANLLGLDASGLRTLRHLATLGVFTSAGTADDRGTLVYASIEVWRAAVAMALTRAHLTAPVIVKAMADADRPRRFQLRHAVAATVEGHPCEFRLATWPNGGNMAEFRVIDNPVAPAFTEL